MKIFIVLVIIYFICLYVGYKTATEDPNDK